MNLLDTDLLRSLWASGASQERICKALKITRQSLHYHAKQLGLPKRARKPKGKTA